GQALVATATRGLDRLRAIGVVVAEPARQHGLAGIAALAALGAPPPDGRRPRVATLVAEAQPHVAAVATLLRGVIGPEPGTGTRGAIRARQEALEAAQIRFLGAVRADRNFGVARRYAIYREVAATRDDAPTQGSFAAMLEVVATLERAHTALAAGGEQAGGQLAAFEAAVTRLSDLAGVDSSAGQ
ncbi:MAG TPA: hypothetical protein VE684_07025, partial [Crenalkalicoccus sp.]|nr:hypothetical protein [Crenalkalicoccus sp.]